MKRQLSFIILLFSLICCYIIACQSTQYAEITSTKLRDNIWMLESSFETTMYLVEGTQKALLIDTGARTKDLNAFVSQITEKPVTVVLTHAHGDHAGNINHFPEIWMHPADTVLLRQGYKGKIHYVKEGDIFDLGGTQIEVSHMPAHTLGSIVLLDRKSGIGYSGDAFGANHVWLQLKPLSPMQTYVNSCLKMEEIMDSGITKLYCGHYVYATKAYDKSYIIAMRELAEGLINNTAPEAKPYDSKIGCDNPMFVENGPATIVFDPDNLNI